MFLDNVIRRRAASLLRPWLLEEPELEVKLGLVNSQAVAKNLRVKTSLLDELIDETDRFFFKDVTVQNLSIWLSNWSVPAFRIEVQGVHVTLASAEMKVEGSSRRVRKEKDSFSDDLKKKLSMLDPEGSALHSVLAGIFNTNSSRNRFTTSVLNLMLTHCQLQIRDVSVQVEFSILNDLFVCLSEMKDFNAESQYLPHGCLLRGFFGAIFSPSQRVSYVVNGSSLEIGFKRKDQINRLLLSTDMFTRIKLDNLQLVEFSLWVPELSFSFSPADLSICSALGEKSSRESKHARDGRQLWELTARKIGHVTWAPRLSFCKTVVVVSLWLRYVKTYEQLLSLVGFPEDHFLERSRAEMSKDETFLSSIKYHWKVISDIEKELPAEAIAQARRIARHRATSNFHCDKDTVEESVAHTHVKFIYRILCLFALILKFLCFIFHTVAKLLCLRKVLSQDPKNDGDCGAVSEDPCVCTCFHLNLGKIVIAVSQMKAIQPSGNEKLESHIGVSYSNFLLFHLSIEKLLLLKVQKTLEQSVFLSCGQLKIDSSSLSEASVRKSSSKNYPSSLEGHPKKRSDDFKSILWCEPARMFHPETSHMSAVHDVEGAWLSVLENFLAETWLSWRRACMKFNKNDIQYSDNPSLLCEIRGSLTFPCSKHPDSGFWKCNLILGKLNLALGFSSMLSVSLLLRQIEDALSWTESSCRAKVLSHSPRSSDIRPEISTIDEQPEVSEDGNYNYYGKGMKTALLRMLPEKHIQLGIFIAGSYIRMSFKKEFSGFKKNINPTINEDDIDLAFDVNNIAVVVQPASTSDLASLTGSNDSENMLDILTANEKYECRQCISLGSYLQINGLNAYVDNSADKQQSQILEVKPMTVHLSSFRDYLHSFGTTIVAFKAAFSGTAEGFTSVSYMDEWCTLFQVVGTLSSEVSHAYHSFDPIGPIAQEYIRQEARLAEPEKEEIKVKGAPLICDSVLLNITGTLKLKSVDIVLHVSRMSDNVESSARIFDALARRKLAESGFSDCGIWVSVQQTSVEISCQEQVEVLTDFSGIQFVIFRYHNQIGRHTNHSALKDLPAQSLNWLYEISLSDCKITLHLAFPEKVSSYALSNEVEDSTLTTDSERPTHWSLINVELGEIFVARCSLKHVLFGAHQLNKLKSSLPLAGEFQGISWNIQGGFVFIETTTLAMFIRCLASCLHCVRNLLSVTQSFDKHVGKAEHQDMSTLIDHSVRGHAQETFHAPQKDKQKLMKDFKVDVTGFSLALVAEDESGGVREFMLEVDVHSKFKLANMKREFIFDLSRLSVFSQVLRNNVGNEIKIPHFSSVTLDNTTSCAVSGDPAAGFQKTNGICVVNEASCSRDPLPKKEVFVENCASEGMHLSNKNRILEHLCALIEVEKPEGSPLQLNQVWQGKGLVSGFEMTISLSETQLILSMISSISGVSSDEVSSKSSERRRSSSQESDNSIEAMVPNGAIVAIQDVHQHMYFTVECGETKCSLGGVLHYSLAGERALFRVKYHVQRILKSRVLWFSLISLHAKNDSGKPLCLSYSPGSGFVDISSTEDSGWALWRALTCEPESYDGDIDWEPYNQLVKRTFYLVNKKNGCAVAFVNGIPAFVQKPGNPFKLKVFHDLSIGRGVAKLDSYHVEASESSLQHNSLMGDGRSSLQSNSFPCIDIRIKNFSLTIVHELLGTMDKSPLLRGSMDNTHLILQVQSTKTRLIGTSSTATYYFDAQRNLWSELIHPVEICIFYRSSFQEHSSTAVSHGVPVHIYCRIAELNIFLTELSLDILLFVIGRLDLAGPFWVRSSMILANCLKVENWSGLNLLCHFYNKQSLSIAKNQSASVFLRDSDLANQSPEDKSVVSVQLAFAGSLRTYPIRLSPLQDQALAWRTRIMSVQDSKSYPGPFVVVDISRKSEDGLSMIVSPLTRIHNETGFSMELRFQRPEQNEDEIASVLLKSGETIDDSVAMFDAVNLSGGLKKALMSLSVGNFLFSFRPIFADGSVNSRNSLSAEWSDDFEGGKAVRLSGIFDQLGYRVRKAFFVQSSRCSFSTAYSVLKSNGSHVANMHFLIQRIGRDVPIMQPDKSGDGLKNSDLPVALQEQKEIFLLPTVKVSNLLHSEIRVVLNEKDICTVNGCENIGNQATISCGSTVDFYVDPSTISFIVTLTAFDTSCKPVNSSDWVKKLSKHKGAIHSVDSDLDFGGGKYFASLRLSRGDRGVLEAAIFTPYALKNDTDFSLYFFPPDKKPLSRDETGKSVSSIPLELGLFLPPKSTKSWFLKSNKLRLKLLEDCASQPLLDLDALSGLAEISLEVEKGSGVKSITKLGVSVGPLSSKVALPSQVVTMVPRYVVLNESEESIAVRQCYLQDDTAGMIHVSSKQRETLRLQSGISKRREFNLFENFIRKHRNANDESFTYIQFQLNNSEWSGPVCIASLGRFFLKFRRQQLSQAMVAEKQATEYAVVHVVEEGSSHVLHFRKPPDVSLPYRIENCLQHVTITYNQKESSEQEVLKSGSSMDYVWGNLTLPHKLVLQINGDHQLREIDLDKVCAWKPFYRGRGLISNLLLDNNPDPRNSIDQKTSFGGLRDIEMAEVGYEVYADGPTRILRVCKISGSHKGDAMFQSCAKIQLSVSQLAIRLQERKKQDGGESEMSVYTPIIVARLGDISLVSLSTGLHKYYQISLQSLNLEEKWIGAPFAAMLRTHQLDSSSTNDCALRIVFVQFSASSNVVQVTFSSIVLQPLDLNLDEETLMKIVPFWRKSLSESNSPSRQFYFEHFEIHPIKVYANFLPGESYSSYSSAEETLRSLLHSVVKVPPIKDMVVELNGVLVTHALITIRELCIRCGRHYSWYIMRAIYIAKGSPLLPPDFVSIFDDLASSSLDVFFDPSHGKMNLPGLTLGTFKLIKKCIDEKGFSGTKRYIGDLGKTLRTAGSNVLFAAVTEISDSVLKGAETSGFNGMVSGFHRGILKLAIEPSLLGTALLEGGPDRKIKLDRSAGVDELYIEGYLQAMLDSQYRQEYLRVSVIDDQVVLKNLPPNSSLIEEIMDDVKAFLMSKALLKGDTSTTSRHLHRVHGEREWKIGPTLLTLGEHLLVSFSIRALRKQADQFIANIKRRRDSGSDDGKAIVPAKPTGDVQKAKSTWKWGVSKFVLSGILAYVDGRLCRGIPNPLARRIVSGFLLSFLDVDKYE